MQDAFDPIAESTQPKRGAGKMSGVVLALLVLILGGSVAVIAYFGLGPMLADPVAPQSQAPDVQEVLGLDSSESRPGFEPVSATQEELQQIVSLLSQQATDVPTSGQIQVAVLRDLTAVAQDPFFSQAQAGDLFILYPEAGKVYLLRPDTGQLVQHGQLRQQ